MGGFAAMAQNDYGISIIGFVSVTFGLLFIIQLVQTLFSKDPAPLLNSVELGCLAVLSLLLSFRVFYIHFALVEWIFGAVGFLLIFVYFHQWLEVHRGLKGKSVVLSWIIVLFYFSIVTYIASMITVPFFQSLAEPLGIAAFVLLILFTAGSFLNRNLILDGERVSAFSFVARLKNQSVVVTSLFLLFTLYSGLTRIEFLPKMYSDEFPQSYFLLIDRAEKGIEKPVKGKHKHEGFKEKYDQFVERHAPR
jgi:hypothetical protein